MQRIMLSKANASQMGCEMFGYSSASFTGGKIAYGIRGVVLLFKVGSRLGDFSGVSILFI